MLGRRATPKAGSVDVVVIGAGQAGLAMSRFLSARGIDHVVIERGEIANSWAHERWDSLKLLTPNWQTSLPGFSYSGPRPDDFMAVPEIVRFIQSYAQFSRARVVTRTEVTSVQPLERGYRVITNRGEWRTRAVVIASGAFNLPIVPRLSEGIPGSVAQITPHDYRNPAQLQEGGVLVVGASATGVQLAAEIQASGRPVTIAVGEHVRMPRIYRGRDIQFWRHATGSLDDRYDAADDIDRARGVSSPQLVGSRERKMLDLNALRDIGVRQTGRLAALRDGKALFSGSLKNVCKLSDLKMNRLLDAIDDWIAEHDADGMAGPIERFAPTAVDSTPAQQIDLNSGEIRTVLWATGFVPDYSWLEVPVLDRKGRVRHEGGIVDAPGMVIMGLPFMRRRKSSFIHGAEDDARDLSDVIVAYLDSTSRASGIRVAV